MKNSLLRLLIAITLVVLVSPVVKSQNFTIPSGDNRQQSLQGLYDLGLPGGSIGAPDKQYELSARIVADPVANNRAFVVVEMVVSPGWHVYAVTQPKGALGMPTVITLADSPNYRLIGKFAPNEMHESEKSEFAELPDELHKGTVQWFAPIEVLEGSRENLAVDLAFKGQVCDDAMQIGCIPINSNMTAKFDAKDATGEIAKAKSLAATFVFAWPADGGAIDEATLQQLNEPTQQSTLDLDNIEADEVVKAQGIGKALLWAFLGGLILNIMPCVLPVIGLKILSFFEQAGKNRTRAFMLNLWYSLGILLVFLVLAALSVGLSKMFTHSLFGIIMCCIVFAMALSLMEVWELRAPIFLGTGKSERLMRQEGVAGALFKGIITTLLAIPCGAPLLSPALAWADMQVRSGDQANVFLAYTMIGLGMASPYLIIGAFPELIRFLPKPGAWMDTFKKIMGFVLLAAVIWILYFLPLESVVPTLALLFALWFGCWYIGRLSFSAKTPERLKAWGTALAVFAVMLCVSFPIVLPMTLHGAMERKLEKWGEKNIDRLSQQKHWSGFSVEKLEKHIADGKTVIVDFTADWCPTCKVIERTVLTHADVLQVIDEKNIITLQADWTDGDADITNLLRQLGGEQVPVVAIFDAREPNKPIVFRGELTTQGTKPLLEQLEKLP